MDVVVCTDNRFVMPTGVMMYSLCCNNPSVDVTFHILVDDSVSTKDRDDLKETISKFPLGKILFYDVDLTILPSFPSLDTRQGKITKAVYYRLMLAEILPTSIHKVLYMDGDLIVRDSLLPLWNTDITGYAVAATADGLSGDIEFYNRLRYPFEKGYFNSGVLLVNLDYWRQHSVINDFCDFMKTRANDIALWDQDVMNYVFQDHKVYFPIKYNLTSGYFFKQPRFDYWKYETEVSEALKNPVVVHFAGDKPWYAYQKAPHPFNSTWFLYQDQTKWKGVKYDYRSLKCRLSNFFGDCLRLFKIIPKAYNYYTFVEPID